MLSKIWGKQINEYQISLYCTSYHIHLKIYVGSFTKMFILKKPFVLAVLFFVLYVLSSPNSNAISNSVPSTLHNKSELNTTQLYNLSNFYK